MAEFLKIEHRDAVCICTIAAPKTLNALNSVILGELNEFLDTLDTGRTRCLIVTGEGEKAFVAGADISEMAGLNEAEGFEFGRRGADVFRRIERLPIPVIAAVNGFALGGGCELAMACDIRLCSDNARFGQPEVGLGIIPGFSGTWRLARIVGMGMAKQMIFAGKPVRADEALRIGLVNAVYPPSELMDEAVALADSICANAPLAVAMAKECINEEYDLPADEAIRYENELFGNCFATRDQKEGMRAFLHKEKVAFEGR
ncbi:MAG: 3-hydroxybutyryl-CoA dehydratase [bacterium P3]|nr:MAG: 3-hydroxybutyryl-CoA dehydratase [bacterium P3]KWW38994.1 MAG: 3-hydroxybutyryl-CoA dehydratase [bacterium F083]